jgi:ArsR family transcriptional regulator, cadmium/lead-responsive transcriptional repressor
MPVNPSELEAIARLGRAIADPTRCRLLLALAEGPAYPAVLARALDLTRSNVSNHLTRLRDSGLVVAVQEGRQVRYELASAHLGHALAEVLEVVGETRPGSGCLPHHRTRRHRPGVRKTGKDAVRETGVRETGVRETGVRETGVRGTAGR